MIEQILPALNEFNKTADEFTAASGLVDNAMTAYFQLQKEKEPDPLAKTVLEIELRTWEEQAERLLEKVKKATAQVRSVWKVNG